MLLTIVEQNQYTCTCVSPAKSKNGGLEVKSGQLYMIQVHNNKARKVPVYVRVYRSRFEHYAVISRNQTFTNNSKFISIKNCTVHRCDNRDNALVVIPDNMEGTKVTFETKDSADMHDWLSAFNSIHTSVPKKGVIPRSLCASIPRSPSMDSVEEDEEESD